MEYDRIKDSIPLKTDQNVYNQKLIKSSGGI